MHEAECRNCGTRFTAHTEEERSRLLRAHRKERGDDHGNFRLWKSDQSTPKHAWVGTCNFCDHFVLAKTREGVLAELTHHYQITSDRGQHPTPKQMKGDLTARISYQMYANWHRFTPKERRFLMNKIRRGEIPALKLIRDLRSSRRGAKVWTVPRLVPDMSK